MNQTFLPAASTAACELQVLAGPQAGAVLPLKANHHYRVGSEWGADIVLRHPAGGAQTSSATLALRAEGMLLEAVAGDVAVDGTPLPPGQARLVPWNTPWQVGEATLAVAGAGGEAHADAGGDAGAGVGADAGADPCADADAGAGAEAHASSAPHTPVAEPAQHAAAQPRRSRAQAWSRRLATAGAAVVAASLSMWALAMAIAPTEPRPDAVAQRAQSALHAAGMTAVSVSAAPGQGGMVVEGYLDTHAQRTQAESLLAALGLRPRFSVWINENVARAVQDVYRVHGIGAQVQMVGPGGVRVSTALADTAPLAGAEQAVRRDVQGLKQLEVRNAQPASLPSPIPALDDPGKRVASIVAGMQPYVVTQDGTRYFIGALLPTGHRILAIEGGRVELEREGQNTALAF